MRCNKIKRINVKNVSFFEMVIIVFEASLSTTRFTFGNDQVRGTFIAHLYNVYMFSRPALSKRRIVIICATLTKIYQCIVVCSSVNIHLNAIVITLT
jgi:hypothetical protein